MASPPEKVEVAVADEATKFVHVIVEVAVIAVEEFRFPDIRTSPCTEKVAEGEVVPIPTLPLSKMVTRSVLLLSVMVKTMPEPEPAPVIENLAEGGEVPIPRAPAKVEVAVVEVA